MEQFIYTKDQINSILRFLLYILIISIISMCIAQRVFGIDSDYTAYERFYDSISSIFSTDSTRFEPGFYFLSYFIKINLGLSITWLMYVVALTSLFIKFYLFRKNHDYFLIFTLYLISFSPMHEMTQVRAALGIGFAFLALYKLSEKKIIVSALLFLLSITFHYSTLYFLVAYIIPFHYLDKKITARHVLIYSLISTAIFYFALAFIINFFPIISLYVQRANIETFNFLSVRVIVMIPALYFGYHNYSGFSDFQRRCYILTLTGLIITPVTAVIPTVASRLYELSMIGYFFWIPSLKKGKVFSFILLIIVSVYLLVRNFYISPIFS